MQHEVTQAAAQIRAGSSGTLRLPEHVDQGVLSVILPDSTGLQARTHPARVYDTNAKCSPPAAPLPGPVMAEALSICAYPCLPLRLTLQRYLSICIECTQPSHISDIAQSN